MVGTGAVAEKSHLPAFEAFPDQIEVVAAVDVDPAGAKEFCAKTRKAQPYTDLAAMLDEQRPNLVSICTPPHLHVSQCVAALRAGAWVWCEKPPTLSLAEYDEIVAAEREGGPYASFVFQHRFGSGAEHCRNLLASGDIGAPLVAHCQTTWYRDAAYYAVPWRGKWESEGGGPALGLGIHQIDLLLHLLGEWREMRAMTGRLVHDIETEDVSTALVRFASGTMATVVNSALSPDQVSRIRLDCENATVELTHLYGHSNDDWTYSPGPHIQNPERVKKWRTPADNFPSSHTAMLREVLRALRSGERPVCNGRDGRRALEFIAAMYKAAATGKSVQGGEIGPRDPFYAVLHGGMPERLTGEGIQ